MIGETWSLGAPGGAVTSQTFDPTAKVTDVGFVSPGPAAHDSKDLEGVSFKQNGSWIVFSPPGNSGFTDTPLTNKLIGFSWISQSYDG